MRSKMLYTVIFFGTCWGFFEATLGYILHLLKIPGVAGLLLFPLGCYFMFNAFKIQKTRSVVFYTALVAAAIKLTNLFIPGSSFYAVINPAISIVLESLILMAFFTIKDKNLNQISFGFSLKIVLSWRMLYLCTAFILGASGFSQNIFQWTWNKISYFIIIESFINSLLLFSLFRLKSIPWTNLCNYHKIPTRIIPILFFLFTTFLNLL